MKTLVKRYQKLLDSEESLRNLASCIQLVNALLERFAPSHHSLAEKRNGGAAARLRQRLAWLADRLSKSTTDSASDQAVSDSRRRLMELGEQAGHAILSGQEVADWPEAEAKLSSLLLDFCLLVFHQVYHALLPKLGDPTDDRLSSALADVLIDFAERLNDPGDRAHALAQCYEFLGDMGRAAQFHAAAVRSTPSDAHNFMTMLQTHWMFLVDQQLTEQALDVLLEAYPRVCRADLDEMGDLIRTTFELQRPSSERQSVAS